MSHHQKTEKVGAGLSVRIFIPDHEYWDNVAGVVVSQYQRISNNHFLVLPVHQVFSENRVTISYGKDFYNF